MKSTKSKKITLRQDAITVYLPGPDGWVDRGGVGEKFTYLHAREVFAHLLTIGLQTPPGAVREKSRTQIPAFIAGFRTEEGCQGKIKGVEPLAASLAVIDFDEGVTLDIDEVSDRLPYEHVVYTTRSDQPVERHYRLLIRLSRPISTPDENKAIYRKVDDLLGPGSHPGAINKIQDVPLATCDFRISEDKPPLIVDDVVPVVQIGKVKLAPAPVVEVVEPAESQATADSAEQHLDAIATKLVDDLAGRPKGDRNDTYARHAYTLGGAVQAALDVGVVIDPDTYMEFLLMTIDTLPDCTPQAAGRHRETIRRQFAKGRGEPLQDLGVNDDAYSFSGGQYLTDAQKVLLVDLTDAEKAILAHNDYGADTDLLVARILDQREETDPDDLVVANENFVPLDRDINYDPEFPLDVLPPRIQKAMEAIQELTMVPPEIAIQCVLAPIFLATQRRFDVDTVVFGSRPVTNYFLAIAPSGGLKSSIFRLTADGFTRYIAEDQPRYEAEKLHYDILKAEYDKAVRAAKTPEDVKALVKPLPPVGSDFIGQKATVNGFLGKLATMPCYGLFSSEAGSLFSSHAFQNQVTAQEWASTMTDLWDGQAVNKLTGMEELTLHDRSMAAFLMVQDLLVNDFLGNQILKAQGIHNRFLMTATKEVRKRKLLDADQIPVNRRIELTRYLSDYNQRIYELLETGLRVKDDGRHRRDPIVIHWDTGANRELAQWADWVDDLKDTVFGDIKGFAARVYEHGCRLAAGLAIFEGSLTITPDLGQAAMVLMNWYLMQRMKVEGAVPLVATRETETDALAREVIEKLIRRNSVKGEAEWTQRDMAKTVVQGLFKAVGAKRQKEVLAHAVDQGWLVARPETATNRKTLLLYRLTKTAIREAA